MANLTPTLLVAGGIFNLCFAVFHLCFWRLFRWKEDLASLTPGSMNFPGVSSVNPPHIVCQLATAMKERTA